MTDGECVAAGKLFDEQHGEEAWKRLRDAWGIEGSHYSAMVFRAGLAMGFVEALKAVRDATPRQ